MVRARFLSRLFLIVFAVIGLSLLGASSSGASAADLGESIKSYDVAMTVNKDGLLHVKETIAYDFGGNSKHGIYRTIPTTARYDDKYDRIYKLENLTVTSPSGAPSKVKVESGTTTAIRIGDPNRTVTGAQSYVIDYDIAGALNSFTDHVELYWNAIGTEWSVPITASSATVTMPAGVTNIACFAGPGGSSLPCTSKSYEGSRATFRQGPLGPYEALSVVVAVPAGSVPAKPILKERFSLARAFAATPATLGGLGAILLLLGGGVGWLLWSRGRDRRYVGQVMGLTPAAGQPDIQEHRPLFTKPDGAVEFAPPDGLRPGQVGTLIDEEANVLDVTATIIDLAVRKFLFIEELPRSNWFTKRDWKLTKLEAPADQLLPYEVKLYNALFSTGEQVLMSDLKNKFAASMKSVQSQLYTDVVKHGWFLRRPDQVRAAWTVGGVVLTAAGAGLTFLLAKYTHAALVGIGVILAGVLLLATARFMPARTAKGSAALSRVLGFRQYIKTAEVEQLKFEERESIFSRYLPYAIVFGETDRWAKAFASLAAEGQAGIGTSSGLYWYSGPNAWNLGYLGSSMTSFTDSAAGVLTSTPSSSGSSGFGGGGFSGGGGGGGGGGSW
ncbi:MAG: DUF2207 domain-containing protein [Mycobacteriales bacterium]